MKSKKAQKNHSPHDEAQLVPDPLSTRKGVLKVVHGPTTLLLRQLAHELVVVLLVRRLEDDDGALVLGQAVDDVDELLAGFELLVLFQALLGLRGRCWSGEWEDTRVVVGLRWCEGEEGSMMGRDDDANSDRCRRWVDEEFKRSLGSGPVGAGSKSKSSTVRTACSHHGRD